MATAPEGHENTNLMFSCLNPKATAEVIETYISAKLDDDVDCMEIVKVKMLADNTASVIVKGMTATDKDKFVNQKHKICGSFAEVSIANLSSTNCLDSSEDDGDSDNEDSTNCHSDIIPDMLEVTCHEKHFDTEILEMYFSGKKSGGRREKEIESVEEIENRIYHVKFESEEDAAAVIAQTKHVLSKTELSVRYVPAPIPKEYDKNKLIVRDIHDKVDEEFFTVHIERCLGLESEEDFTTDFRAKTAIITFNESYTDKELSEMMKKLTSKKVRKQMLTVERCEANCSIIIRNISKKTFANKDSLEMYFEHKKTGGGEDMVESVVMLGENSAKITFINSAIVDQVLKSTYHLKKLGSGVVLTPCTPLDEDCNSSLGEDFEKTDESEEDQPQRIPLAKEKGSKTKKSKSKNDRRDEDSKGSLQPGSSTAVLHSPIILPLDSMIAKYLDNTPTLVKEMSDKVQVDLSVDEKAGTITLSQSELSPLNWPSIATENIQLVLSDSVCKADIHVPSQAAGEIYPIIIGGCTQEGLQYALGQGDNKVYVTGKTQSVKKLKSDVEELCGRMIRKVEIIDVSEEEYAYMKGITFSIIQKDHPSIQFKCVDIDHSLSVDGSLHDVSFLKQNFSKYISHFTATVSLHPLASDFLRVGKGLEFLQTILQKACCVPFFIQQDAERSVSLVLLSPHDKAYEAENLALKVRDSVKVTTVTLPKHFMTAVGEGQKLSSFKEGLTRKTPHCSIMQNGELIFVSNSEESSSVFEAYRTFINEECSCVDSIHFKKGAWRFLQSSSHMKKWIDVKEELKTLDVSIVSSSKTSARKPFVKIKGMPESIAIAKEKLMNLQSSIIEQTIPIARPGVCQYFFNDTNGKTILKGVETQANVCIEMGVKEDEHEATCTKTGAEFVRACFGNTKEMKTINVYVGDITEFNKAEVIVNAANENLMHAGGVAKAIEAKGGIQIRKDSEKYVNTRGKLNTGSAVIFPRVGNLPPPYKAIVHAVGPKWMKMRGNDREKLLLKKVVFDSLKEAKNYNSIAIPAISGGIYGFPSDVCAMILMEAAKAFSEKERNAALSEINFVVLQDSVDSFISAAKQIFPAYIHCPSDMTPQSNPTPSVLPAGGSSARRRRRKKSFMPNSSSASLSQGPLQGGTTNMKFTRGIMEMVKITQGDIFKNLEDVIVNPTDQKFSFNGFVATALKTHAGPGLEEECDSTKKPLKTGDVITTGAHSLSAQYILHIVLPSYKEKNSVQKLTEVIVKCLDECNRLGMKSISIPSVGAGNLQYPPHIVAKCLLETCAEYLSKHQHKSLQLVHFVIFDTAIHQEFQKQHTCMQDKFVSPVNMQASAEKYAGYNDFGEVSTTGNEPYTFSLPSNLCLEVIQGDIASACVDVVVNTTNPQLKLIGGGVASALAKKAGPALQIACDSLIRQGIRGSEGKVVETSCINMGALRCKSVFHIVFSKHKLEQTIFACLERAEAIKHSSIAFPAIGTGWGSTLPLTVANAFVNALKKFINRRSTDHLKVIQIVLFQSQHYSQFLDAFKTMEPNSGGFLKKMINAVNAVGSYLTAYGYTYEEENCEEPVNYVSQDWEEIEIEEENPFKNLPREAEIIISIYGENQQSVGRAEKHLRAIIETQFVTEEFVDQNVTYLSDSEVSKLENYAKSRQVDIHIDRDFGLNSVRIHGCQKDVLKVKDEVRKVLASYSHNLMKEEAAEAMSRHVKWITILEDGEEDEYEKVLTFEIESAFQKKEKKYVFTDESEQFEIDFISMKERNLSTNDVLKVKRLDLLEDERPQEWDPMPINSAGKEMTLHLVTLAPNCQEFMEAEKKFNATMAKGKEYTQIHSIQRLQNPVLYSQYIARKKEMNKRNPNGHENEKWLFHGTGHKILDNINTQGFNRIFKGKNGTVYGQGVYFARDARYSNRYAHPDGNGFKFMYLTQVLTGEYIVGNTGMDLPPPKDPKTSEHVLFDSTVDNQASPSIFVVYYDSLNYPAYLIKYK